MNILTLKSHVEKNQWNVSLLKRTYVYQIHSLTSIFYIWYNFQQNSKDFIEEDSYGAYVRILSFERFLSFGGILDWNVLQLTQGFLLNQSIF